MSLAPQRIAPPTKGVNTASPLRSMTPDFAVALDNIWLDQGQYLTRRPCQHPTSGTITIPATTADSIKHMFEVSTSAGVAKMFAWVDNGSIYQWTAPNTWSAAVGGTFTARPRTAILDDVLVVADGVSTAQTYVANTDTWANITSLPTGVTALGNILHTHKARMYNAGVTSQGGYVYYSDIVTDTRGFVDGTGAGTAGTPAGAGGAFEWAPAAGGGFIKTSSAIAGYDIVTGISSYKGFLVVFMNNHIIFYSGEDPSVDFAVAKVITGIGCISQDTIKGVGNDMVFLSQYGFKSLEQIMVQGDAAAKESSTPINNYVVEVAAVTTPEDIRAEYIEELGVYLCNMKNVTFAYHPFFGAWTYWYDIQPQIFKRLDGTVLTADVYMHYLDKSYNGDQIGVGAEAAAVMAWELPPIKAAGGERKARWNRLELIFESEETDSVSLQTYVDVKQSLTNTDTMALAPTEPSATAAGTTMVWGDGTPSADPLTKWGGTVANDNVWGGLSIIFSGSAKIPLIGRGEFMSVKITNSSISKIRLTALELYSNTGGIR